MIAASLFLQTWLDRKTRRSSMPSASDPRQPVVCSSRRRALPSPDQRPAQPTQRAAQPAVRPVQSASLVRSNLFNGRVSGLLLVRLSIRLLTRLSSPLLVRPSLQAVPALSSRHLPSERRPSIAFASGSRFACRCSGDPLELQHACSSRCSKKGSPVPMIVGVVVAVLALAAMAFFVVPAVKGLLRRWGYQGHGWSAGYGDHSRRCFGRYDRLDSLREPYRRKSQKDYYAAVKSSTPICRSSPVLIRSPHSWMRPRLFSSSWKAPTRAQCADYP